MQHAAGTPKRKAPPTHPRFAGRKDGPTAILSLNLLHKPISTQSLYADGGSRDSRVAFLHRDISRFVVVIQRSSLARQKRGGENYGRRWK